MQEIQYRINKLLDDERVTVTTSAQQILDLATITKETKDQIKTLTITNVSSNKIYFGTDATVTTTNAGGVIKASEKVEWPLMDLNFSPYFIAASSLELAICFWG